MKLLSVLEIRSSFCIIQKQVTRCTARCSKLDFEPVIGAERVKGSTDKEVVGKQKRNKPGTMFLITMSLINGYFMLVREEFLSILNMYCNWNNSTIVSYVIAVERSFVSASTYHHIHSFIETSAPTLIGELREYILSSFPDERLDIQSVRSKRNVLKYISKEDTSLIHNVKISSLNFNYKIYDWAQQTAVFKTTDPFVVEHRFNYKFLEKYLLQQKYNSLGTFTGFRQYIDTCKNAWTHSVAIWWNDWVRCLTMQKGIVKKQQMFLWGPTNVGKSWFIEKIVGRNNMKFVFMPGVGKFFMQGYNPEVHKVIIFEEFNYKYFSSAMLKRLLEGRKFAYPVKCELDKNITHLGPVIFVSNYNIRDCCDDEALLGRLLIINADCRLEHGSLQLSAIFKEENDSSDQHCICSVL